MANNQMTFTLGINTTADLDGINKLKSALKDLNSSIADKDSFLSSERLGFDPKKINEASVAINTLNKALTVSFDSTLGGINFNKFQQSIRESGFSMQELQRRMAMVGSEGYTAFAKVTAEALKMNETVKYGNSLTEKLWSTFKNTVTYTAFNALINTVSKSISRAVTYVQDLDSSLNDIRIVSGQSAEQMADFAVQANEAAKALGSNTKSYTEAALIYYQQGLTGTEVTERTDVTTKMANVTGESAQQVSEDLTAIWNNFYDGSKSLEYYADVITALGAATASSTDEISEGLGKFAAIADTVGLSYEYATTALATVVAETRQSADTVGTAFKTLFARLQGLTLGETLDDGTDLNKYSQALAAVGISIKDQNGQLRNMDDILNDMGSKWQTLNKDQQVALAQTVAGTRQYTYLVSLMDKWETFQTNLNTATSAQGELNKQNNIYLESTEAHLKQLNTAAEDLYSSLFDNKIMNTWIDGLTKGVEVIDTLVESMGGLNNILPMLIAGGLNSFSGQLATSASNFIANKQNVNIGREQEYDKASYLANFRSTIGTDTNLDYTLTNQQLEQQVQFASDIYKYRSLMSKEEVTLFNNMLQTNAELVKQTSEMEEQQSLFLENNNNFIDKDREDIFGENGLDTSKIDNMVSLLSEKFADFESNIGNLKDDEAIGKAAKEWLEKWEKSFVEAGIDAEEIREEIGKIGKDDNHSGIASLKEKVGNTVAEARQLSSAMSDVAVKTAVASEQMETFNTNFNLRDKIKEVIELGTGISQLFIGLNMLKNVSNIWDDNDLSVGEKILQIFMALSFAIPSIVKGLNSMGKGFTLIGQAKNYIANLAKHYRDLGKAQDKINSLLEKERKLREKLEENKNKSSNTLKDVRTEKEKALVTVGENQRKNIKEIAQSYYNASDANEKEKILENNEALKAYILTYAKYRKELEETKQASKELTEAEEELREARQDEAAIEFSEKANNLGQNIKDSKIFKNLEGLGNGVDAVFKKISKGSIDVTKNGAKMVSGLTQGLGKVPLVGKVAAGAVESIGAEAAVAAVGLSTLAIAAVAVGAAFLAWKIHDSHLKTLAAEAKNAAEAAKEHSDQVKAESDSLNQLKTDYDNLISQYKESAITQQELKNQAYDLCMQYGDESLAVKALTGDYEDLEEAINGAQEAKALELMEADKATLEASRQSASMAMFANSNSATRDMRNGQRTLDLGADVLTSIAGGLGVDTLENTNSGITSALENLGSKYNIEDVFYGGAHLNIDALLELYARDREGLLNALEENNSSFSVKIMDYLTEYSDEVNAYAEAYAITIEDSLSYINESFDRYNDKGIIKTYREAINELTEKYLAENPDMTEEEASQQAKAFLSQDNDYQDIAKSTTIAENILGEDTDTTAIDDLAEKINGLSNAQKEFLASNIELYKKSGDNLDAWLDKNAAVINALESNRNIYKLNVAMQAATSNGTFSQEDIDNLFDSDTYTLQLELGTGSIDIDKELFEDLDFETQELLIQSNIISENIDLEDAIEADSKAIEELQDQINNFEPEFGLSRREELMAFEAHNLYEQQASKTGTLWELEDGSSMGTWQELVGSEEDFQNTIDNLMDKVQEGQTTLTNAEYAYVSAYAEAHNKSWSDYMEILEDGTVKLTEQGTEFLKNRADAYDDLTNKDELIELQEQLKTLQERVDSNKASLTDWSEALKNAKAVMAGLNKDVDSLQSVYQTLSSAVSEYNENHRLTVDTVQALISLDSGYLASLNLEGDTLSLNTSLIELQLEAEKQRLRLSAEQQLVTELQSIAQNQNTIATLNGAAAEIEYASSVGTATEAMKAGYPALVEHIKAMQELSNLDSGVFDSEAGQRAIEAYYNRLKLIDGMSLDTLSSGGGSSSKTDKKDEKNFDDEFDRYWDINKALDKISDAMDKLEKTQSKLHGKELINSLRAENKLLEEQAKQYDALAEEQNKELSEINTDLSEFGFKFNENGEMQNYIAQTKKLIEDFNGVVEQYNAGEINEETYNNASEQYEKARELIGKYDELINSRRENQKNIDENARKIKENNLQAWEVELEVKLDTKQAERDWNDFFGEISEDFKSIYTDFGNNFRISMFDSTSLSNSVNDEIEAIKHVQKEIDKMKSGQDSSEYESISQAQAKLKELSEQMRDDAKEVFDLYKQGWEDYNSYIDEAVDKFDKLTNKFEKINEDLDHQAKLIELLYGQNDYDNLNNLYEVQKANLLGEMESLRDQANFFKNQYEELASVYGEDSDAAQKFKESWENAVDELHSQEEAYLETLTNKYSNIIEKAFSSFEKQMAKGSSYDFISDQWDKSKEAAEGVFDEQERIYELQTLGNKYQKAIDKATSTSAQKKLTDLYESQVKSLEDKTRLTQYDVELAEKRLAVAEAEAALEDARNAKNTLKVTRGDDGNWAYQYVADDANVADKEQSLLDAQKEAYEYVKQNISDTKELMMTLAQDWSDTIKDLELKMIGATEEEKIQYQAMIDWYNEYYSTQMNIAGENLKNHEKDLAVETNALLMAEYQVNTDNYNLMTENQKLIIDGLKDHMVQSTVDVYNATGETLDFIAEHGDEVMRETVDYFSTAASEITDAWANNPDSVKIAMEETLNECKIAMDEYTLSVKEGCISAGENFTDVGAAIDKDREAVNNLENATTDLINNTISELDLYGSYLEVLEGLWNNVKNAIDSNYDSIQDYLKEVDTAIDDTLDLIKVLDDAATLQYEIANGGNGTGRGSGISDLIDDLLNKDKGPRYKIENAYGDTYGAWDTETGNWGFISGDQQAVLDWIMKQDPDYLKNNSINNIRSLSGLAPQFDTGGYTGSWGDGDPSTNNGKLAVLHEKELILNQDDTKNMLSAVDMIRNLTDDVQNSIQQAIANNILKALTNLADLSSNNTTTNNTSNIDSSQQNIFNINAEFPNAENIADIQAAILGLPNAVSQYTGRKTD